jgi:hypothetical protein
MKENFADTTGKSNILSLLFQTCIANLDSTIAESLS